jgi:glutamate-1-semialdehyde 2,1-aminomutase
MPNLERYSKSLRQLLLAEERIPLGSQTFSKSRTQYPVGISPLFASKAKGSRIWDLDGNEYVDLVNSLAAITVGYKDRDVDLAVKKQLSKGIIYSLPGILEFEVAQLICDLVPSAEMVRFAKNGTDATSGAIRLARAYTGRKHIAKCGYHGWQDWSIGTTSRNKGIPTEVSQLSHTFGYNNLESLRKIFSDYSGEVAAVILEPMTLDFPENDFLVEVQKLAKLHGALLIFDEIVTGFRFSEGGAQELFGVTPDITTLGKGIANGYPLSAIVGSKSIMKEMEEIFFSGTFGGELLSLAAAKAVLTKHTRKEIVPYLSKTGDLLDRQTQEIISSYGLSEVLQLKGHPTWKILQWHDTKAYSANAIKTLFLQEMFLNGVLIIGSHNVSTAMTNSDLSKVIEAYDKTLAVISAGIKKENLLEILQVEPLEPLFKVR